MKRKIHCYEWMEGYRKGIEDAAKVAESGAPLDELGVQNEIARMIRALLSRGSR